MNSEVDGAEVVATVDDAARLSLAPFLILESLRRYLDANQLGSGEVSWERIGEGQANLTYLIRRGDASFVLRRGPRPPFAPSTHDMIREARIQRLVSAAGVRVPNIISVCEDPAVLGVPFYIMDYLEGYVITDSVPAHLDSPEQRRAIGLTAVDALVELHELDVSHGEISSIGRPDGYLERQVRRFGALWKETTRRSIPEVIEVGDWLAANVPTSQRFSVVHGDYRIGNLMYAPQAPASVRAILDWEMATLGDPLADLGYLTATYATSGSAGTPIELTSVTREPGFPSREELVARYSALTGLDASGLAWYQALAMWKAAIFCEAIYTRWLQGQRPNDTFAPRLAAGIPAMIEESRRFIEN